MNEKHIIKILDNASLRNLSEAEQNEIRDHVQDCVSCRYAYEAARLSTFVLRKRAESTIKPSPFFQTKVMAALREQQAAEDVPALLRLWRSSGALISAMAVTTAALAAVTFMLPTPSTLPIDQSASVYSMESVILDQNADEQMTYEQVLSTIYEDDDEAR
jgi:hypothetical protein